MGVKLRKRKQKSGKVSLYLDIYHKGKRTYEFLDLYLEGTKQDKKTEELAEAIRAKKQVQLFEGKYEFERKSQSASFTDFVESISKEDGRKGAQNIKSLLVHIRGYDKQNVEFDSLNAKWLKGFKKYLLTKVKKNTARTYFLILRSMLNKAAKRGIIKGNPLDKHSVSNVEKDPAKIEYLSDKGVQKLWDTDIDNQAVKRAFLFSVYTGIRIGDILNLTWNDISEITDDNGADTYYQVELKQEKTNDYVHIPVNKKAEPLLEAIETSDKVFDVTEGKIRYWLKIWAERAGIKHLHFHMARHTFATKLLRRGVDIYSVSKLLGHQSVSSTEKYLHLMDTDKKKAIDLL